MLLDFLAIKMAAGKKGKAKTVDEAEKERLEEEARLREQELEEERQRKIEEVKFNYSEGCLF